MKNSIHRPFFQTAIFFWVTLILTQHACQPAAEGTENPAAGSADSLAFTACLQKHLDAVSNKDLPGLESTLSPDGNMQLILPNREITNTVAEFVDMHRDWFQDTSWTFETKILNAEVGPEIGAATTEIMYREPNRNGKPFFNRMAVSYTLKKINGRWYVIKDHACSLEKSEH
ncbi:MAG: nuclear transport factor 2 family protein [Saprospiraceae bacterium]|nr:nuclear transport factor 2 family protein [Lewinellaceae bacterium]